MGKKKRMQLEQRKRALMMLLDNKVVWFLHNLDQVKGMTVVCTGCIWLVMASGSLAINK